MGRAKYSDEERIVIVRKFLKCTTDIIREEGLEQISIRKVAQRAGFNSATLYLYFNDSDELITLACMHDLEDYYRVLLDELQRTPDVQMAYRMAWQVFCQHAFRKPQSFLRLFFYPHSKPLKETVRRYYEIYPELLDRADGIMRETLLDGTLSARNARMLRLVCRERNIPETAVELISSFTICYLESALQHMPAQISEELIQERTEHLLDALDFLLNCGAASASSSES